METMCEVHQYLIYRLVNEYISRKRYDDADLKRGLKHIADKNHDRNPLTDGDINIEIKPIRIREVYRRNEANRTIESLSRDE